jgi:hypothetical protein
MKIQDLNLQIFILKKPVDTHKPIRPVFIYLKIYARVLITSLLIILVVRQKKYFFYLNKDSVGNFELEHHEHFLQTVTVQSHRGNSASQTQNTISANEISRLAGSSLSQIVQQIAGVSSSKNGSTISKPVIHGMSGE